MGRHLPKVAYVDFFADMRPATDVDVWHIYRVAQKLAQLFRTP